jgi:hypothetical protein
MILKKSTQKEEKINVLISSAYSITKEDKSLVQEEGKE